MFFATNWISPHLDMVASFKVIFLGFENLVVDLHHRDFEKTQGASGSRRLLASSDFDFASKKKVVARSTRPK